MHKQSCPYSHVFNTWANCGLWTLDYWSVNAYIMINTLYEHWGIIMSDLLLSYLIGNIKIYNDKLSWKILPLHLHITWAHVQLTPHTINRCLHQEDCLVIFLSSHLLKNFFLKVAICGRYMFACLLTLLLLSGCCCKTHQRKADPEKNPTYTQNWAFSNSCILCFHTKSFLLPICTPPVDSKTKIPLEHWSALGQSVNLVLTGWLWKKLIKYLW